VATSSDGPTITLRPYRSPDDAPATFAVFQAAVRQTAAALYDQEQIEAWAGPADADLTGWDVRRREAATVLAESDGEVVGFSDLRDDGLVDMLFVHPRAGGRGVARMLVEAVQADARSRGLTVLRTFASRSAKPAFERLGFTVVEYRPDNVARNGVVVPNYEMRCALTSA
jgi:putative acetyltransferase